MGRLNFFVVVDCAQSTQSWVDGFASGLCLGRLFIVTHHSYPEDRLA